MRPCHNRGKQAGEAADMQIQSWTEVAQNKLLQRQILRGKFFADPLQEKLGFEPALHVDDVNLFQAGKGFLRSLQRVFVFQNGAESIFREPKDIVQFYVNEHGATCQHLTKKSIEI